MTHRKRKAWAREEAARLTGLALLVRRGKLTARDLAVEIEESLEAARVVGRSGGEAQSLLEPKR